ncbi:MAG: DUF721 domain-containing protein [Bacteroidetes bacterium]|nr:DUF721 domain-containing protein [Bacteroidota bacterium]
MQKKTNHQFTIAEALNLVISDKKLNKGLTESLIKHQWAEIMGEVIAKHTTGMYLNTKNLYVYFNSSVIKNEFIYNKDKAIALVNEALGYEAVEDLIVK